MTKRNAGILGIFYLIIEAASLFIILRILKKNQASDVAGTWIFLYSLLPLSQLAISGYGPLVTREVAKNALGLTERSTISKATFKRTQYLLNKSTWIVLTLTLIPLAKLIASGDKTSVISLLIFTTAILARMYMQWAHAHLIGLGRFGVDKLTFLICTITALVLLKITASSNDTLLSMTLAYCAPYWIGALITGGIIKKLRQDGIDSNGKDPSIRTTEILKMYALNFSGFLTLNTDVYIAKAFVPEEVFVEFGIASKAILGLISLSGVIVSLQLPTYAQLFSINDRSAFVTSVVRTSLATTLATAVLGTLFLMAYDWLIATLTPEAPSINFGTLVFWLVFACVAINVMNLGTAIIATGENRLPIIVTPIAVAGVICTSIATAFSGINGMLFVMAMFITASLAVHISILRKTLALGIK